MWLGQDGTKKVDFFGKGKKKDNKLDGFSVMTGIDGS
jgi:hypothetical protein